MARSYSDAMCLQLLQTIVYIKKILGNSEELDEENMKL
jgi:hypothetical protein